VQSVDNAGSGTGSQTVIDGLRCPSRFHQTISAQNGKVLRQCRLAQIDTLVQLPDGHFPIGQQAQNQQAIFIRKSSQQPRRITRMGAHIFEIHTFGKLERLTDLGRHRDLLTQNLPALYSNI